MCLRNTSTPPITAYPYTIFAWCRPGVVNITQTVFGIGRSGTASHYAVIGIDSTARAFFEAGAGAANDSFRTGALTANVWHPIAGVATSTVSRVVYADGTVGTPVATSTPFPTTPTDTVVGALLNNTLASFFTGQIAECAMWNVALTATEIAALSRGVSPLRIRPAALKFYSPIWGAASPERDLTSSQKHLTLTNAPVTAQHAPVQPLVGGVMIPYAVSAGGHTIVLGQLTETDTVQTLGKVKLKATGQQAEADLAQTITRRKARTAGQVAETDLIQSLLHFKSKTVGLQTEADLAQTITRLKLKSTGQQAETDLVQPITRNHSRTLGEPTETDVNQPVNRVKVKTLGTLSETDTVFTIIRGGVTKTIVLGLLVDTESLQSIQGRKIKLIGSTSEVDVVQSITKRHLRTTGLQIDTEALQPITAVKGTKRITLGLLADAEVLFALQALKVPVVDANAVRPRYHLTRVPYSHQLRRRAR